MAVSPCRARSKTWAASWSTSGSWAGSLCVGPVPGVGSGVGSVMTPPYAGQWPLKKEITTRCGAAVTDPDVQRDAGPAVTGDEEGAEKMVAASGQPWKVTAGAGAMP